MRYFQKMNDRQLAYSFKKSVNADIKTRLRLLFTTLLIFGGVSLTYSIAHPHDQGSKVTLVSSVAAGTVTMASIGDIDEVSGKESAANQIGMRVWLIDRTQIDSSQSFREPNSDRELGTIPMLDGEYMHYFDAINESPNSTSTGENGDYNVAFTNTFTFVMAGNRKKLLDFIEEYAGRGFIVIYQECETGTKYVVGSFCKPMVLSSFERKDDGDGRYITYTFTNAHWRQPLIYTGDIITQDPVTVDADATDLAIDSSNGRYDLSENTAATTLATVSGITSDDYGRTITIYGAGGDYPTSIADSTTFVLVDGETWSGTSGSTISFKIFDTDTLVEVDRT